MAVKKRSASKAPTRSSSKKARAPAKPSKQSKPQPKTRKDSAAATKRSATRTSVKPKIKGSKNINARTPKSNPKRLSAKTTASNNGGGTTKQLPGRSGKGSGTRPLTSSVGLIHGIPPYQPRSGESYMNDRQLAHFRNILIAWKRELMEEVDRTVHHMQDEASNFPDPNDRATQESEFGLELRTRDRERKLLKKIDSALQRIEEGSYGYCEETGEEIGLKRLEARPVATLCVEAQERRELAERQFRDREDGL